MKILNRRIGVALVFTLLSILCFRRTIKAQVLDEEWRQYDSIGQPYGGAGFSQCISDHNGGLFICGSANGNICVYHFSSAYQLVWETQFALNGIDNDSPNEFIDAGDGTMYVCGYVYDFPTKENAFLARLDTAGNIIWEHAWNSPNNKNDIYNRIALQSNGNIVAVGSTQIDNNHTNALMMLWSPAGIILRHQEITGDSLVATSVNAFLDVCITPSDEIIACGQIDNWDSTRTDALLVSYNASGNWMQWRRIWLDTTVTPYVKDHFSRVAMSNNNIIVGGSQGTNTNAVMLKYDLNGNILWHTQRPNGRDVSDLLVDATGNSYYALQKNIVTMEDLSIEKLDPSGAMLWNYVYTPSPYNGYDHGACLSSDASGNIYLNGMVSLSSSNRSQSLLKVTSGGAFSWIKLHHGNVATSIFNNSYDLVSGSSDVQVIGAEENTTVGSEATILRYDLNGNLIQSMAYHSGTTSFDNPVYNTDATGNIYSAGNVPAGLEIFKRDPAGNEIWRTSFNDTAASAISPRFLITDHNSNVLLLCLCTRISTGQDLLLVKFDQSGVFQWKTYFSGNGNHNELPKGIVADNNGNIYVSGEVYAYTTVKKATVLRYDSNGTLNWTRYFAGSDTTQSSGSGDLVLDGANSIYLAYSPFNSGNGTDLGVVRLDSTGTTVWSAFYNSGSSNDNGYFARVFSDHSVGVVGRVVNAGTGYDIGIVRWDSTGNFRWTYSFAAPGSAGPDNPLDVETNGISLYVCGYEVPYVTTGHQKFFVGAIDTSGVPMWEHRCFVANTYDTKAQSLAVLPSGMVAATGNSTINGDIDVALISPTGVLLDSLVTGGTSDDVGYSMKVSAGRFVLGGTIRSNGGGNTVGVTIKFCTRSEITFVSNLPDSICSSASPFNLYATPAGGIFFGNGVAGNMFYPNSAGLGFNTIDYVYTDTVGGCTGTVSRQVFIDTCILLAANDLDLADLKIYPVPADDELNVLLPDENGERLIVSILDMQGRLIDESQLAGKTKCLSISTQPYEDGLYVFVIDDGIRRITKKILIQH